MFLRPAQNLNKLKSKITSIIAGIKNVFSKTKRAVSSEYVILGIAVFVSFLVIKESKPSNRNKISNIDSIVLSTQKYNFQNENGLDTKILGIRDRLVNYVYNINVPTNIKSTLDVTGITTTGDLNFTSNATMTGLQNIDDVTRNTIQRAIGISGDVVGTDLNNVTLVAGSVKETNLADTLNYEGTLNLAGTFELDGTKITATADEINSLAGVQNDLAALSDNYNQLNTLAGIEGTLSNLANAQVAAGGISFGDGTTFIQDVPNLYWDDVNNRLGIGTSSPQFNIDINGTAHVVDDITMGNTLFMGNSSGGINYDPSFGIRSNNGVIEYKNKDSVWLTIANAGASAPSGTNGAIQFTDGLNFLSDTANLAWEDTYNYLKVNEIRAIGSTNQISILDSAGTGGITIIPGGNVGIGNTNPTKSLDVTGDIFASGNISTINISTTNLTTYGTLQFIGLGSTDSGNSIISINTATGALSYRNLDDRVWGSTLSDGTGISNFLSKWLDSNTLTVSSIFDNGTNVGISTTNPQYKLDVAGSFRATGIINLSGLSNGAENYVLGINTSTGEISYRNIDSRVWGATLTDGAGVANYLSRWSDANTLTTSTIYDNGTNIGIGTTNPIQKLELVGNLQSYGVITNSIDLSRSSTNILMGYVGHDGYTNFSGGIGTGGIGKDSIINAQRITSSGNLVNIGSIQAGQMLLTKAGSLAAKVDYAVPGAMSVAIGDLNGDGKNDLATSNWGSTSISVFLNNGDGTYAARVDYIAGASPYQTVVGDLNGDGKTDIAVTNNGSNTVSVFINNGNGTFASKVDYSVGTNPRPMAIGDLNGDGKTDLAVGNNGTTSISILMNNGNGTFASKVDYPIASNPFSVAIGDLNGDGKADLAATTTSSSYVSVFLNNGNGTFATKVDYALSSVSYSVAIGDVNGDGKSDLAATNASSASVSILMNNGNGTFASKVDYSTASGPSTVAMGDLNGDGKNDLTVSNTSTTVSTLLNNGDGTFASKVDYATGIYPYIVAVGDLNGDGKNDVVTANNSSGTVSVFMNQTTPMLYAKASTGYVGIGTTNPQFTLDINGTFGTNGAVNFTGLSNTANNTILGINTSTGAVSYEVIDSRALGSTLVDGSGVSNYLSRWLDNNTLTIGTIYDNGTNVGIGTTNPTEKLFVAGNLNSYGVITSNIDLSSGSTNILKAFIGHDGYSNFSGGIGTGGIGKDSIINAQRITSSGNLVNIGSIQAGEMLLTKAGTFATKVDYASGTWPASIAIGDLNGDGKSDLATSNKFTNNVSVFINNGNGTFATKVDYAAGTSPMSITIGDLNGDGRNDLVATNRDSDTVSIFINNGNGTFATKVDYASGAYPRSVAIGDLNGDGKADLAVANYNAGTLSIFINNGNGTFASKVDYTTAFGPEYVTIGDVNGDSKADLAIADSGSNFVSVLMNNGNGTFATKVDYTTGASPQGITLGDLNGDGIADLATSNTGSTTISVLINNGNGTFASKVDYVAAKTPRNILLGDVNGDGKADLTTANGDSNNVSVFINNGDGTFATKVDYATGTSPNSVVLGDLNGDGKADLATANWNSNNISILINQTTPMLYAKASTGYVGIGTTDPAGTLEVYGSGVASYSNLGNVHLRITDLGATSQDSGPVLMFQGASSTYSAIKSGKLNSIPGNGSSYLAFFTRPNGTANIYEQMRIDSGGLVGIGVTSAQNRLDVNGALAVGGYAGKYAEAGSNGLIVEGNVGVGRSSPAYKLDVLASGTGIIARFNSNNSTGCTLATGGTISCTSDSRLKENVETVQYGLSDILTLNPIQFDWKNTNSTYKQFGFLAQDVETVIPNLVSTDPNTGYKQLNMVGMVPVLTKAIQELDTKINNILGSDASTLYNQVLQVYTDITTFMSTLGMSAGADGSLIIDNDLNVTGLSSLKDVSVAGTFSVGSVSIDSVNNSLEIMGAACGSNTEICSTQTLYLQKNLAGNIDLLNGKVVIMTNGDVIINGNVEAKKVITEQINIKSSGETLGISTIAKDTTEKTITTSAVKTNSKIFVTPINSTNGETIYIKDQTDGESFTVKIDNSINSDIKFNWFIINSVE